MLERVSRLPFLIAVALLAAAIGDALVETISNTGVLGNGYADSNHLSLIPTAVAGGSLVALLILRRCIAVLRDLAERFAWSPADIPVVWILQFIALFVMESCEQLCFGGKLLGGTVWLGGPVWFSMLAHLVLGASCMIVVGKAIDVLVRHCAVLVGIALEFIFDAYARGNATSFAFRRRSSNVRCNRALCVAQIGERAPPQLLALT